MNAKRIATNYIKPALIFIVLAVGCDEERAPDMIGGVEAGERNGGAEVNSGGALEAGANMGGEGGGQRAGAEVAESYRGLTLNEVVSKGEPNDWIELYNSSDETLDLSGVGVSDDPSDLLKASLPEGLMIPPGGYLLVIVSDESLGFKLGSAEHISLSAPSGVLIDEVSYTDGQSPAGGSYGRLPDGVGPWETLFLQTPERANERGEPAHCGDLICEISESAEGCPEDCISCGDGICHPAELEACEVDCPRHEENIIVINELVAAGSPDWIELFNRSDEPQDLTGYGLSDDLSIPFKATLSELILPANGYLVIDVSDETVGFKLAGDELAVLSSPEGMIIDLIDWEEGDAPEAMSWGRSPDGSDQWQTLTPSPGAANDSP